MSNEVRCGHEGQARARQNTGLLLRAENKLLASERDNARGRGTLRAHLQRHLRVGFASDETEQIASGQLSCVDPPAVGVGHG